MRYEEIDLGDIEVLDELTDEVICTTAEVYFEPSEAKLKEASQADLNHLFGIKPEPDPYDGTFGCF